MFQLRITCGMASGEAKLEQFHSRTLGLCPTGSESKLVLPRRPPGGHPVSRPQRAHSREAPAARGAATGGRPGASSSPPSPRHYPRRGVAASGPRNPVGAFLQPRFGKGPCLYLVAHRTLRAPCTWLAEASQRIGCSPGPSS